jgi:LAO/AO transport system ATPase
VIGVTGPPGAGKSTLVHGLLGEWLAQGRQVAVLAVDPSSPLSGGALLGDRVRMGTHGAHPGVFIRSVASRGRQGALSPTTAGLVDVLDAAGFPLIVVETVGAGQAEVDILSLADTRIVACPPGLGDEVQALKAGILEIADVLAVTKADLPQAALTVRELRDMLQLRRPAGSGGWVVPVVATSAGQGTGVDELAAAAEAHRAWAGQGHRLAGTAADGATATAQRQASPGHPIAATDSEEGPPHRPADGRRPVGQAIGHPLPAGRAGLGRAGARADRGAPELQRQLPWGGGVHARRHRLRAGRQLTRRGGGGHRRPHHLPAAGACRRQAAGARRGSLAHPPAGGRAGGCAAGRRPATVDLHRHRVHRRAAP